MTHDEQWTKDVLNKLDSIGIICEPKAALIFSHMLSIDRNPIEAFALVSAHNAAMDYLNDNPVDLIRAMITAIEALKILKQSHENGEINYEMWVLLCALLAPFTKTGEETVSHAEWLLSELGSEPLSTCFREESEFEIKARKINEESYREYISEYMEERFKNDS